MKRKREEGPPEGSRTGPAKSRDPVEDVLPALILLEKDILESRKNYNSIVLLLEHMREQDVSDGRDTAAAIALYRVFCKLMAVGHLAKNVQASEEESVVVQWLRERLEEYEVALLGFLQSGDPTKQVAAVTLVMRLIKEKAMHLTTSESVRWNSVLFNEVMQGLLASRNGVSMIHDYVDNYVTKHADIRLHTFMSILETDLNDSIKLQNALYMLSTIKTVTDDDADIGDLFINLPSKTKTKAYALPAQKKQAQKAWTSILRQQLDKTQRKKILDLMSHGIAPWFVKVELLMDFLTDAFNVGGSTSLMALSGLFHLMQQKNLDYPQFYAKLYSMLDGNILHSKHRSRFFRLLDTFLASTHLPAALVASFIKKLSHLCLFAPPSGIVIVVPFIYNLLQNHRSCTVMIHRNTDPPNHLPNKWGDPFIVSEPDPMATNAIESSLWEIYSLQSHYHPNVAAIAKIISEQFTKANYNLEDFLDHSYATMLDAELSKKIKKPPEIEYEIPRKIFRRQDAESGKEDSLLVKLWNFE